MGAVKDAASGLIRMLERKRKEAERLPATIDKLEKHLQERPKEIVRRSLDLLLWKIDDEAGEAARTGRLPVAIIGHKGRITIGKTSHKDSAPWLKRLKSEGFSIATVDELSLLIESLKSEVASGKLMRAIEFLNENAEPSTGPLAVSPILTAKETDELEPSEPPSSSGWKLSDFLPALPPYPPLPRGLFKK